MKIALCLSGQARFVEQGYHEVLYPFVLKDIEIDVFIHTWDVQSQIGKHFLAAGTHPVGEPISADHIDKTLKLYNPRKHIVEPPKEFPMLPWASNHMPGFRSDYVYSMFYSIYHSNKLKMEYEAENNFKYDWVIRSRFDVRLDTKIEFNSLDVNTLNTPAGCFDPHNGYVDCFALSNSPNMDVYSDVYNHLDVYLADSNSKLCGEYILRRHIDSNKIPIVAAGWHSLFR
jgi:hypothetical protein